MKTALIVGAGTGLSAALARRFFREGMRIVLAARAPNKLDALAAQTNAQVVACDASQSASVDELFRQVDQSSGAPDVVVYNPSARVKGPLVDLNPVDVQRVLAVTAFGGFLVAQQAAKRMLVRGSGAILLTGASASVKGYPESAPFAMGKFALRGLAQSMARELGPRGVHVAHFVIDGAIRPVQSATDSDDDGRLDPDAIADTYWHVVQQPRSAWTWEVALRPWNEKF